MSVRCPPISSLHLVRFPEPPIGVGLGTWLQLAQLYLSCPPVPCPSAGPQSPSWLASLLVQLQCCCFFSSGSSLSPFPVLNLILQEAKQSCLGNLIPGTRQCGTVRGQCNEKRSFGDSDAGVNICTKKYYSKQNTLYSPLYFGDQDAGMRWCGRMACWHRNPSTMELQRSPTSPSGILSLAWYICCPKNTRADKDTEWFCVFGEIFKALINFQVLPWDMWSEWWGDMTWPTKRQRQRVMRRHDLTKIYYDNDQWQWPWHLEQS